MEEKEICIAFFFLVWKLDFRFDQLHVHNQKAADHTQTNKHFISHWRTSDRASKTHYPTMNPSYRYPPIEASFINGVLAQVPPIIPSIMFSAPKMTALRVTPSSDERRSFVPCPTFDLSEMCFYQKVFPTFFIYKMPQQVYFSKKPTLFRNKAEEWELWVPP